MNICQRIFDCMGQDKTRLRALAKALGTAPSTVSSWKIRHSDPPARYIVPIAEFLGVPPLYLLTGKPASLSTSQASSQALQLDTPPKIPSEAAKPAKTPCEAVQTASPAEAISPMQPDSTAKTHFKTWQTINTLKTPWEAVQTANTFIEPSADLQIYGELNSLYASLDRAGQVIMLAAGYQQQLRMRSASKNDSPPPRTLVLINKILTRSTIKKVATVCPCAYHSDFLFICTQAPTPSLGEPTYFYLALYP